MQIKMPGVPIGPAALLLVLTCLCTSDASAQASFPFGKVYSTNWGDVTFSPGPGNAVVGTYLADQGRITGALSGNVLRGYWSETASSVRCDSQRDGRFHWGGVELQFSADFSSFVGPWSYCDRASAADWTGTLISGDAEAPAWGFLEPDADVLDEVADFNNSCLIDISDPAPPAVPAAPKPVYGWEDHERVGHEFADIQERYASANPEERAALQTKVRDLLGSLAAGISGRISMAEDDDPELTSRLQQMFDATSMFLEETAPSHPAGSGLSKYAAGFLPSFPEGSAAHARAAQWKDLLQELRRHEGKFNDLRGWRAVAEWRAEKDQLLMRLMLAEEEIAWEAVTTPYTEAEMRMLQKPFSSIAAAKDRFAELAESSPELVRLYELLEEYDAELIRVQHLVANDDGDLRYLGLLAAGNSMCLSALEKLEAQNDAAKQELAHLMKGIRDGFLEVIKSRRKRGMEAIRAAQQTQAGQAGQPAGREFRIHRPVAGSGGVGEALARRVQEMVSGGLPLEFGPDFALAVIERDDAWSVPLDSAELERLIR